MSFSYENECFVFSSIKKGEQTGQEKDECFLFT